VIDVASPVGELHHHHAGSVALNDAGRLLNCPEYLHFSPFAAHGFVRADAVLPCGRSAAGKWLTGGHSRQLPTNIGCGSGRTRSPQPSRQPVMGGLVAGGVGNVGCRSLDISEPTISNARCVPRSCGQPTETIYRAAMAEVLSLGRQPFSRKRQIAATVGED